MCIEKKAPSSCFWSLEKTGEASWGLEQTDKQFFGHQECLTVKADMELHDNQAFLLHEVRGMG